MSNGPESFEVIPVVELTVGAWKPMRFDAQTERFSVRWLRVLGGMSGKNDREDWVADLPAVCVSVHDYHWNGDDFGPSYESFDNACRVELRNELVYATEQLERTRALAVELEKAIAILRQVP